MVFMPTSGYLRQLDFFCRSVISYSLSFYLTLFVFTMFSMCKLCGCKVIDTKDSKKNVVLRAPASQLL